MVYDIARPKPRASGFGISYDRRPYGRFWFVSGEKRMSYFSEDELKCQHCGKYKFDEGVLKILNAIRREFGPMPVTSGYRCVDHPIEAKKQQPGAHCTGKAVDIGVSRGDAYKLIEVAMAHGCPRIGVNQRGEGRFVHLDWDYERPYPAIWSY